MNYVNTESWRYMMRTIKAIVILLVPFLSGAQEPVFTLPAILDSISNNNLQLKTFEDRAAAFRYNADAATAWMPPMVGLGTWQTPYLGQMLMDDRDKGMVMLRAEQEIPSRRRQLAQQNFLLSQGDVERSGRAVLLNDLRTLAKKQYYNWLVAAQRMKVLQKNEAVLSTMRKVEEVRYPYNQSQLSSIYRADAAKAENEAMMEMQAGEIASARATLNALMNRPANASLQIDTVYEPQFVPLQSTDTSLLASGRMDIKRMNESIRSMLLNVDAMQLQRRPTFKVQFDHMSPLGGGMPHAFSVMGMVSIPIAPWSRKMYQSEVKSMQLNIRAMEGERAAMLQEVQGMITGMTAQVRSMQKRIQTIENRIIPSLQKTFDALYIQYQEARLQLPAMLDSWEALNMMHLDLLDEKSRLYQMIADYEKEIYR